MSKQKTFDKAQSESKKFSDAISQGTKEKYPYVEVKEVDGQLTEITYLDRVSVVSRPVTKAPKREQLSDQP